MKTSFFTLAILCATSLCFPQHSGHPRLFFTASDTASMFANVRQAGSAANQLYGEVSQQANHYLSNYLWHWDEYPHPKAAFYMGLLSLAFRYLETRDALWSDKAIDMVFRVDPLFERQGIIHDDWYNRWPRDEDHGDRIQRSLSQQVIALSVLYDWLYYELTSDQRTQIQQKIIDDLGYSFPWMTYGGGIRAAFGREDTNRIRIEHPTLALTLGAMSIYGENGGYTTDPTPKKWSISYFSFWITNRRGTS